MDGPGNGGSSGDGGDSSGGPEPVSSAPIDGPNFLEAAWKMVTGYHRALFNGYCEQGFTTDEAMELVKTTIMSANQPKR